ncbi:Ribonuclease_H-like superfamily [Hexamita inflata]|uniref:Ribonuclease H-like superfamily n=1 Tax=Hexamita inflata TaxID=28002 RepID=A0AA86S5Y7_9EUKA|nr:Ribonuclease H-like superfamily [Hexamita inflata]
MEVLFLQFYKIQWSEVVGVGYLIFSCLQVYSIHVASKTINRLLIIDLIEIYVIKLSYSVLEKHIKQKYKNDLAKQQLTYSTIDEYWSLIVTIDEQAQSMLEFVKICQVIPLSEADVERLFSQIGLITNKRRQTIGTAYLNSLVTIKKNTKDLK